MLARSRTRLAVVAALFFAVTLPGCQTARGAQETGWQTLSNRAVEALGGCDALSKPGVLRAATSTGAAATPLTVNRAHAVELVPIQQVAYSVPPELRQRSPKDRGGLLEFTVPAAGTYWIGSKSLAWVDLLEAGEKSVLKPRIYQWTTFCEGRMKAGLFELRASTRYLIQISASPDATVELFIAGPFQP